VLYIFNKHWLVLRQLESVGHSRPSCIIIVLQTWQCGWWHLVSRMMSNSGRCVFLHTYSAYFYIFRHRQPLRINPGRNLPHSVYLIFLWSAGWFLWCGRPWLVVYLSVARFTKYLTTNLRWCRSYKRLPTDIFFTKHLTKDAWLFLSTIHLQFRKSSEILLVN